MDYGRLISALEKELDCQKRLLDVLLREREALAGFDRAKIDAVREEKEGIFALAKKLQGKRENILSEILGNEPEKLTMEEVIACCSSQQAKKELTSLRKELKEIVTVVAQMHRHNSELIRSALGFLGSALSIIRSVPDTELPTYGYNAKLSTSVPDPAFGPRSKTIVRSA